MDSPDKEIRASMDALRRIVRALRLASTELERDLGVTVAQLFVLRQLADGRSRSINELAHETVTDPSTISGLVRRLIDARLVDRGTSSADGRRAQVSLTVKGEVLLTRAPVAPQSELMEALAAMPRARRKALAAGLTDLASRLGPMSPALFFEDEPKKR